MPPPPQRGRGRGGGPGKPQLRNTRGGIQKGPRFVLRTDRDGDVSMDSPAPTGPSGRGNRTAPFGRPTRTTSRLAQNLKAHLRPGSNGHDSQPQPHPGKATLKISGLRNSKAASNPDGGLRSLMDFLERKAARQKPITIGRGVINGDYVWLSVNKDDAPHLLRLNGYTYAGAPLTIEETAEPMPNGQKKLSPGAKDTEIALKEVLARRYNAEQKLLDLSALGADETLSSLGIFESARLAEKSFSALVHLASIEYQDPEEKRAAIQAISLARNDIQDVDQVNDLVLSFPHLLRLDLSDNRIVSVSKISQWQHEFRCLEELHLTGNPVVSQPNYLPQIIKWFPSLQNLDGRQIRSPEQAAAVVKASNPNPLPQLPSNLRDGDNNVASTFLRAFFQLFDHDRPGLVAQFYDDDSWFSLSIIADSGRDLPWKSYEKYSRNVHKLGHMSPATLQRLFTGGNLIADLWKQLPATRHPTLDEPDRWLIDCHTFPHLADPSGQGVGMGLMINVNGKFEEADPAENLFGMRTFSRAFILGSSKPGAPHPYRVVSDQLTLHRWEPQAIQPGVQAPVASAVADAPPAVGARVPDDSTKAQLIAELSKLTGMTAQYSELCLSGVANWDFNMALKSFEEQKANLPPEAFIPPA
ncbi:hypothetical protein VTK56DRAFT_7844 [Thermocarpiscus australiensis]